MKNGYLYAQERFLNLNSSVCTAIEEEDFLANQLIYANLDDQNVGTIHIKGNYARLFEYCVLLLMWFWFKKFKPIQNKKNDIVDSFVLLSALYSITLGHLVLRPCTVNPFIYDSFIQKLWLKSTKECFFKLKKWNDFDILGKSYQTNNVSQSHRYEMCYYNP